MTEQLVKELEAAAQLVLAPPNIITTEQRRSAEEVFLNFRKANWPYQLCVNILKNTTEEFVLFEVANALKSALIKEWPMLQWADITLLKQYLLHLSQSHLAPYIRERILQIVAVIIKKGSIEDSGEAMTVLLNNAQELLINGDIGKQLLGCSIFTILMQEYELTSQSSTIGLPKEIHYRLKSDFEDTALKRIFKLCIQVLDTMTKNDIHETILPVLNHLIYICESTLSWEMDSNRGLLQYGGSKNETFYTPTTKVISKWKNEPFDPALIDMFFNVYWKVRSNPELAHHSRNCLYHLSYIHGIITENPKLEIECSTTYVQNFLKLLSNIDIMDHEAIGIAHIFNKLSSSLSWVSSQLEDLEKLFLEQIIRVTCLFVERAATEELMHADDCPYTEAFQVLIQDWIMTLMFQSRNADENSLSVYRHGFIRIFNAYLQCHISSPDGSRRSVDEEPADIHGDDADRIIDQLQIIGNFGQHALSHSLPLLSRLLEDRTRKLQQLNQTTMDVKSICEDLHWLVLIAGHVLGCGLDDDTVPEVPDRIRSYLKKKSQQGSIDMKAMLEQIQPTESNNGNENSSSMNDSIEVYRTRRFRVGEQVPMDLQAMHKLIKHNQQQQSSTEADHAVRLVAAVFQLSEVGRLKSNESKRFYADVVWFLHGWSLRYLVPPELVYTFSCGRIEQERIDDSPSRRWLVERLIEIITEDTRNFRNEAAVLGNIIAMLVSFSKCDYKSSCLLESEHFQRLIQLATKSGELPAFAKRGLLCAIVKLSCAHEGSWLMHGSFELNENRNFPHIIEPLKQRLRKVIDAQNVPRNDILDLLETLIGIVQGVRFLTDMVLVIDIIKELPVLLNVHKNDKKIVQLILEIFCECSKNLITIRSFDSDTFLHSCKHLIQAYGNCSRNYKNIDNTDDEDFFEDVLLFMQLLTYLLHRKFNSMSDANLEMFKAGFSTLMRIMSLDILEIPVLCLQYFNMIKYFCEHYVSAFINMPEELAHQLLSSLELGLRSFEGDVFILSCDIIRELAESIYYSKEDECQGRHQLVAPFINVLMDIVMTQQIRSHLITPLSKALYYLISCYQEKYQQLVQRLIGEQTEPMIAQRLTSAFNELTRDIIFGANLSVMIKFIQNLQDFSSYVQGFLVVK